MHVDAENLSVKKTVLLFYKEYESDKFVPGDRYLKRILRPLYHRLHHRQKKTGFAVSFELMCSALTKAGYDVHVNDYKTARDHPDYPVGLVGFPVLLKDWKLSNPAILGPSLFDHPMLEPRLFDDSRFRKYVVLAPWTKDLFATVYGSRCFGWFAGIDTDLWPDLSAHPKQYDFLVYDKVRWDHDSYQTSLIEPILRILDAKGLTYRVVRYKMHDHATYRSMLGEARGLLFLCEHETQGLAYQEAMASGVPVLAWDRGYWADPLWNKFAAEPPAASSVPFFSPACGETFKGVDDFEKALDRFRSKSIAYRPRDYVISSLSPLTSARIYAEQYFSLLEPQERDK